MEIRLQAFESLDSTNNYLKKLAAEGAAEYWRGIYSLADGLTVKCAAGGEEGEYKLDKGDFLLFSYSPAKEGTARVALCSACGCAPAVCAEVWR